MACRFTPKRYGANGAASVPHSLLSLSVNSAEVAFWVPRAQGYCPNLASPAFNENSQFFVEITLGRGQGVPKSNYERPHFIGSIVLAEDLMHTADTKLTPAFEMRFAQQEPRQ